MQEDGGISIYQESFYFYQGDLFGFLYLIFFWDIEFFFYFIGYYSEEEFWEEGADVYGRFGDGVGYEDFLFFSFYSAYYFFGYVYRVYFVGQFFEKD